MFQSSRTPWFVLVILPSKVKVLFKRNFIIMVEGVSPTRAG